MTLQINDQVPVPCPKCGPDNHLVVCINRYGRLFLGCPNYGDPINSCTHTQSIPTDVWMKATGQPSLFPHLFPQPNISDQEEIQ